MHDFQVWLEKLAPSGLDYRHHQTGEDNADAHLKRTLMGHQVMLPITNGRAGPRAVGAGLLRRVRRPAEEARRREGDGAVSERRAGAAGGRGAGRRRGAPLSGPADRRRGRRSRSLTAASCSSSGASSRWPAAGACRAARWSSGSACTRAWCARCARRRGSSSRSGRWSSCSIASRETMTAACASTTCWPTTSASRSGGTLEAGSDVADVVLAGCRRPGALRPDAEDARRDCRRATDELRTGMETTDRRPSATGPISRRRVLALGAAASASLLVGPASMARTYAANGEDPLRPHRRGRHGQQGRGRGFRRADRGGRRRGYRRGRRRAPDDYEPVSRARRSTRTTAGCSTPSAGWTRCGSPRPTTSTSRSPSAPWRRGWRSTARSRCATTSSKRGSCARWRRPGGSRRRWATRATPASTSACCASGSGRAASATSPRSTCARRTTRWTRARAPRANRRPCRSPSTGTCGRGRSGRASTAPAFTRKAGAAGSTTARGSWATGSATTPMGPSGRSG